MTAPKSCLWCHAPVSEPVEVTIEGETVTVCSSQHEAKLRDAQAFFKARKPVFFVGLAASAACVVAGLVLPAEWLLTASVAVLGATIAAVPAVTPQTIDLMGFKRGVALGRGIGVVCLLGGIAWTAMTLMG